MTDAIAIPADYEVRVQPEDSFQSFNAGDAIPSDFINAVQAGWISTKMSEEALERSEDIHDSLKSLEEGKGIALGDLRSELDA